MVTRRPLSDNRTLGPTASPDATDQDSRDRYPYYLTPTNVSEGGLAMPALAE